VLDRTDLASFLRAATVADEVFALRPDPQASLIAADGVGPRARTQ
jgi:hypothetical protein